MTTRWKIVIVATALIASLAAGLSIANWLGLDVEIAQGPGGPISIDLKKVMLRYDDPMRGMAGEITYRQVFQDALWWQINDPQTPLEERVQAFLMVGLMHEGRGTEIDEKQRDILMKAIKTVWGPGVVTMVEKELGK